MLRDLREIDLHVRNSIEGNDVRAYRAYEREFHLAIYAASGLRLIATMLMDLWTRLEPYRGRRHSELGLLIDSLPDREAIIAALERGNGRDAAAAMRRHVDRGYARMLEVLRRTTASASAGAGHHDRAPVAAAVSPPEGSLVAAMHALPDARRRQGRMFPIGPILALAVLAMFCGESSVTGIARWGQNSHPAIREALGLTSAGGPSVPTMHRVLGQIDAADLAARVEAWLQSHGWANQCTNIDTSEFASIGMMGECLRNQADSGEADLWPRLPELAIAGHLTPKSSQMRLAITELRLALRSRTV
jgi:hypothetical protein